MEKHGGNVYACSRRLGIPVEDVLDFSASINPLGPPLSSVKAVMDGLKGIVNYPDPDNSALRDALSQAYGIPAESVLAGNGSTEFIYLIPRLLRPESALVLEPSFSDYARASRLAGAKFRRVYLDERDGFRPDLSRLASAFTDADMAFVCNPNNPTGVLIQRSDMLDLMEVARSENTFLVIDEAFIDYAPGGSVIAEAATYRNVALLRNFTKFFGMPGVRSGYVVSHPETVERMKADKEPWTMNSLAEAASVSALEDGEYARASMRLMDTERPFLYGALADIPGIVPYTASANFILARLMAEGIDAPGLASALEKRGILIRDCSNFEALGPDYIRLAVRTRRENGILVKELGRLLSFTHNG